jgi:hypothetical protein
VIIPKWHSPFLERSILLQQSIRKTIYHIHSSELYESFVFLNRLLPLADSSIDWRQTFSQLNDCRSPNTTDFNSSYTKRRKLKLLLHQLPTCQRMKLIRPDLFVNLKCPSCNSEWETDSHVYSCKWHAQAISTIQQQCFNTLLTLIRQYRFISPDYNTDKHNRFELDRFKFSQLLRIFSKANLTFVDAIRGLVPSGLFYRINQFIHDFSVTRMIISVVWHDIFSLFWHSIWLDRCNRNLLREQSLGISKRDKRSYVQFSNSYSDHSYFSSIPRYDLITHSHFTLVYRILYGCSQSSFFEEFAPLSMAPTNSSVDQVSLHPSDPWEGFCCAPVQPGSWCFDR